MSKVQPGGQMRPFDQNLMALRLPGELSPIAKVWIKTGLKLNQNWIKSGLKLVYNCTKTGPNWTETGLKLD